MPNNAAINTYLGGFNDDSDYYDSSPESGGFYTTMGSPEFVIFASCWTLVFVFYVSLTSTSAYTRTDRPMGRFFNRKIVFAVDSLSAIFWFTGFIGLALFYQNSPCGYEPAGVCDTMIISVLVGVGVWYCNSPFTLRMSIDMLAGSHSSQQASWQRVTCFVLVINVLRSTPMGSSIGSYSASTIIV